MLVTILGSGTAVPVAHRGPTSVWVTSGETSLLFDCGSGALQKLYQAGGDLRGLDGLFLSHAHLDHLGDLTTVCFALRVADPRDSPLPLYHSRALGDVLDGLVGVFGEWLGRPGQVRREPLEAGRTVTLGDLEVETFEVSHHATSLGYRLRERSTGATLAIPSDTELCQSLIDAVRGVDLLLIECSATDGDPMEGHLSPSDLRLVAEEARPGAMMLTHLYPEAEAAGVVSIVASRVGCPVYEAADGRVVEVGPAAVRVAGAETRAGAAPVEDDRGTYPDEAAPIVSRADTSAEAAAIRAMMEAELAALDDAEWSRRKFDTGAVPDTPSSGLSAAPLTDLAQPRAERNWTADSVAGIRPSRAHRKLRKRAAANLPLPEVNLRGLTREAGLTKLQSTVQTWAAAGTRFARVITGKGRHSADVPVLKVATLNWLDRAREVVEWAPEFTRDGNFGAVVVAMRR